MESFRFKWPIIFRAKPEFFPFPDARSFGSVWVQKVFRFVSKLCPPGNSFVFPAQRNQTIVFFLCKRVEVFTAVRGIQSVEAEQGVWVCRIKGTVQNGASRFHSLFSIHPHTIECTQPDKDLDHRAVNTCKMDQPHPGQEKHFLSSSGQIYTFSNLSSP